MDIFVPFASGNYFALLAILGLSRGADFVSTHIGTPRLALEGNPLVKWLGWKRSILLNVIVIPILAICPPAAVVVSMASTLVAARNFQTTWIMRSMGEDAYLLWYQQRVMQTSTRLRVFCLAGETLLIGAIGVALIFLSPELATYTAAIGMGIIGYALAIALYTLLSLWRSRWRRH